MGSNLNVVMLMVTQNYDAFGSIMPYNANAGGVTILGAFGSGIITASFVYYQNLQENEAYIGEASSHETGHMFGLSHDGLITAEYYTGVADAADPAISWGPIMGASYGRSLTKFSDGDYPNANNPEDDVAIISSQIPLRTVYNNHNWSTAYNLNAGGVSTIFITDIIHLYTTVNYFRLGFSSPPQTISIQVTPFQSLVDTPGNNVDIGVTLTDLAMSPLASSTPPTVCSASIIWTETAGRLTYYIAVYATGNALSSVYGSQGQYNMTVTFTSTSSTSSSSTSSSSTHQSTSSTSSSSTHQSTSVTSSSSTHQSTSVTSSSSTSTRSTASTSSTASKSVVIYQASMQTYPTGWIVNEVGSWKYGTPTSVYDPHGFVVAGNVITGSGLYPEPITDTQILNSAFFSTLTFSNITLTFDRFLGVSSDDHVSIKVYTPPSLSSDPPSLSSVWENVGAVNDTAWQQIELSLSSATNKQQVQLQFGLGPVFKTCIPPSFGWNIKNIVVRGISILPIVIV